MPTATPAQERPVRIGLIDGVTAFVFSAATTATIIDERGQELGTVRTREAWQARRSGKRIILTAGDQTLLANGPVRILPAYQSGSPPMVYVGKRWYRGILEIRDGLIAINELPMEDYLYGVVPCEMPHTWPLEALKAQAVAARTYTVAKLGEMAARGYDLKPTTDHQVYGGAARETPESNLAVDATRGEVVTYNGRPIPAYYCSAAGGYTDGADTVWGGDPVPYLQAVPDFDQAAPSYLWQHTISAVALRSDLERHGISIGDLTAIEPLLRGYSGRVRTLAIRGSQGDKVLSGERFRYITGLKSSLFNVAPELDEHGRTTGFTFAGRGHGHGVGLSQWGSRGLGQMGYSYVQILSHYYPHSQLTIRQAALP
ncbi:MAG: SpoIID/LytB domain-containing protein [Cyanobacteria bacterium NC_groundwater_1444_Ag_S-0.65um_54_12]|nr:SpoIID/LytB domain-containing protein [Cyanobacteria bacterium NC_groundwater_1444_Ag_S-0.65um_54_12]